MFRTTTRTKILNAALELFSNNGYRATTTRSIAEKAGVNELTLFRNFETKENLLKAVLDHNFNVEDIRESAPTSWTGDPEKDLETICGLISDNLSEREAIIKLMLREQANNEIVHEKLHVMPALMKDFIVGKVKEALSPHAREDIDWDTAGVFLASHFIRSRMWGAMLGEDPFHSSERDHIKFVIDIFLNGILKEEGSI